VLATGKPTAINVPMEAGITQRFFRVQSLGQNFGD
jgi:hypothetical protein